jgi:hypothetical protein
MPISKDDFEIADSLLNDPEQLAAMSPREIDGLESVINIYRGQSRDFSERMSNEGFNEEQISKMLEMRADNGDPSNERTPSVGFKQDLAGIKEGAIQAVEGVADVAKDITVGLGIETEEDRTAWKQSLNEDRLKRREAQIREYGDLPSRPFEFLGQVAPYMAAAPASAATLTRMIAGRVVQGGVMGSAYVQEEGRTLLDRLGGFTVGASIGAGSTLFAIPEAARNTLVRGFVRSYNEGTMQNSIRLEEAVINMTGDPRFAYSLAQSSGSRASLGLESAAAGAATKTQQEINMNILLNNVTRMSERMTGEGKSAGQIAIALRGTLKEAHDTIYKDASTQWGSMSAGLLDKFGDDVVVRGSHYLDKIDKLILETEDRLMTIGGRPSKDLLAYRAEVDELVNPVVVRKVFVKDPGSNTRKAAWQTYDRKSGVAGPRSFDETATHLKAAAMNEDFAGIDTGQSLRLLNGLNRLIGGQTAVFDGASPASNRTIGRALMGVFTDELKASPNKEAVEGIKGLRKAYADQMTRAGAVDNLVVNAIFGKKKLPSNSQARLDSVLRGESEDLVAVRNFLEEWNAPLLDDLRATHLKRITEHVFDPAMPSVDDAGISLRKMAKVLSDKGGRPGRAGWGLHTPEVQADLVTTGEALRVIANKYFTGIVPGGVKIDDIAINVISRTPEFMGRLVTRALSSGQSLEQVLLNPSLRKSIQVIAFQD